MRDATKVAVTQAAGAILIASAVVWGAWQVSDSLRGAGGLQAERVAGTTAWDSSPVSPRTFRRQWAEHYAETAEERCWRPFDAQYLKLPGHLDLTLDVSVEGTVRAIELIGYTNPGDTPDPVLTQRVFDCVSAILKASRFPAAESAYAVEGRVDRPDPPRSLEGSRNSAQDGLTPNPDDPRSRPNRTSEPSRR